MGSDGTLYSRNSKALPLQFSAAATHCTRSAWNWHPQYPVMKGERVHDALSFPEDYWHSMVDEGRRGIFFSSGIASDKILMFLWIQIDSLEIHTEHMCAGMCWVCALVPKAEPGTQHMVHVQVYAQTVLWRPSRTWHTHVWVCKHVLSVCWYQAQNWAHSTCVIVTHWRYTHRTRVCRHVLRVCSGA